jgi:hypothetical protein
MPQTYSVGARSLFVTATAWLFILLAAFVSVSAVLQQAAAASLWTGPAPQGLPLLTGLLVSYLPYVMGATLVLSLATLASAIGLLMRLEWARKVFIGLIMAAIVMNLTGLWLQHEVVVALLSQTLGGSTLPPAVAGVFGGFVVTARVLSMVLTLVACVLLAWIIRRLMSPMVKQEFA